MPTKYETAVYTHEQLESARTKGQLLGWAQGGASVGLLMFLLKFLGWIPLLLIASVVGFAGYKIITKKRS